MAPRKKSTEELARYGVDRAGLSDEMVGRVLDAADVCIATFGLDRTTMTAIAREAGVSRQTLHRLFDTREQMILALATRQIERLLTTALPKVAAAPTAEDRVIEFTLMWGRGLPDRLRASEAFRSEEFRSRVSQMLAPTRLTVEILIEHLSKVLVGAPGVERLRYPDDVAGNACVVHHFAHDIRQGYGGPRTLREYREHLRRYLIPALFREP